MIEELVSQVRRTLRLDQPQVASKKLEWITSTGPTKPPQSDPFENKVGNLTRELQRRGLGKRLTGPWIPNPKVHQRLLAQLCPAAREFVADCLKHRQGELLETHNGLAHLVTFEPEKPWTFEVFHFASEDGSELQPRPDTGQRWREADLAAARERAETVALRNAQIRCQGSKLD